VLKTGTRKLILPTVVGQLMNNPAYHIKILFDACGGACLACIQYLQYHLLHGNKLLKGIRIELCG
jgi:hypothetical protein